MKPTGNVSSKRVSVESASPSGGIGNVSQSDNSPVMMNKSSGMQERGSRADELVEMVGNDSYSLGMEAPRKSKIKG